MVNKKFNDTASLQHTQLAFAEFVLDTSKRCILRGTETIELTPKVYDLLLLLIEAKGQIVSKQRIYETVWSNRVVSDTTLYKVIEKIRVLLNDDKDKPRFIKTIHGEGYQFCCEVVKINKPPVMESSDSVVASYQQSLINPKSGTWYIKQAVVFVAVVAILMTVFLTSFRQTSAVLKFNSVKILVNHEDIDSDRFSLGFAKFTEDLLYSYFSNYKQQIEDTHSATDMQVVHNLSKFTKSGELVLTVAFQQDGNVIKQKTITAQSEQQLLFEYMDFLKSYPQTSGKLFENLMRNEFSHSIELLTEYVNGLGHFESQENHQAGAIFKQISEQHSGFVWAQLYYSLALRRSVDLPSSLGRLIQLNKAEMSSYLLLIFHRVMAFSYLTVGDYDQARSSFVLSKGMASQLHQHESLALIEVGFHKLALFKFNFSDSKKHLDQAMQLAESLDDDLLRVNMFKNYCTYHSTLSNVTQAIKYCELALAGYHKLDKPVFRLHVNQSLSELYLQHDDIAQAIKYNDSAIQQAIELRHHNGLNRAYWHKIYISLFLRDLAQAQETLQLMEANVSKKDHTSTTKLIFLARFWVEAYQNKESAVVSLETYGRYVSEKNLLSYYAYLKIKIRYYIHKRQYEEAARWLEKASSYQKKEDDPELVLLLGRIPSSIINSDTFEASASQAQEKGWYKLEKEFKQVIYN